MPQHPIFWVHVFVCPLLRRPHSACHVEQMFSLMGHIQTKDCLHLGNNNLHHLATLYPPIPCAQEPPCARTAPLVPRSNSRTTFFYHGIGFFMVLVDAGQLFRCAGQHFMCVAPPSGGTLLVSHRRTYPLRPSPLPFTGLGSPFKGLSPPFEGLGSPLKGLGPPFKGLGSPLKGVG